LFGDEFIDPVTGRPKTCVISLINANSPLTWDATMLGALKTYARANQATIVTPFILAGAMSPVTVAGTVAQTLAESLAGM
ncbi:trimethylamine methyltransferase family protein, partial [Shewanella algae]|uniref:trimethylamine methyltransferase family protein n=1 Tax=Shewanella algae TaxID=38313 RepID=UPI00313E8D09